MKYIAICGTVGSGKTTLLRRLTQRLGDRAAWHEERPQDNPFITDYYADTKRWTFHAQVSFLSLYFDRPKWREETAELFFFDRCFLENLVIAQYRRDQGDLTEYEYQTLCQSRRFTTSGRRRSRRSARWSSTWTTANTILRRS